mmetsp:Transcript_91837/g.213530  ORF Transcript_91837/g.213530 Transcript_91837/m.213530 type:complete len:249 (+) Transcript_91837:132-878(+)
MRRLRCSFSPTESRMMCPTSAQESFQTCSPTSTRCAGHHRAPELSSHCQMTAVQAVADTSISQRPSHGFQETSRMVATCCSCSSIASGSQPIRCEFQHQTCTPPSPAVAIRAPSRPTCLPGSLRGDAHDTASVCPLCAWNACVAQRCSTTSSLVSTAPVCQTTVTVPSAEAQANAAPRSAGAQATAFNGPWRCRETLCTVRHPLGEERWPQIRAWPSAPAEASSTPREGGAHATWYTAPAWPPRSARK